jgi:phage terminase Nu1 subunit (DNA packaging protein)
MRPPRSGNGWRRRWADSVELKNARARGALVDSEAVAREWEGICRTIRAGMLRVPKRAAARLPHLTPQDVRAIDGEVRAALTELAADSRQPKNEDGNEQ